MDITLNAAGGARCAHLGKYRVAADASAICLFERLPDRRAYCTARANESICLILFMFARNQRLVTIACAYSSPECGGVQKS